MSLILDLKLYFQPGRVLYKVEGMGVARRIVTSPEAYGKDRYHVSDRAMAAYEEALFNYLKGILLLFLILS